MTPKILVVALTSISTTFLFFWLLSRLQRRERYRLCLAAMNQWDRGRIIRNVIEGGDGSHSFITLYDGFQYHADEDGVVAFAQTPWAWVVGAEPVGALPKAGERPLEEQQADLLGKLAGKARPFGKRVIVIPVRERLAEYARRAGFKSLQIGCEPLFELKKCDPRPELIPTARQLQARGAHVVEIAWKALSARQKAKADAILKGWLKTRKMPPLGFMNQVDPWMLAEHKRYFFCFQGDEMIGFIGAAPYRNRRGWYLVDVLRTEQSPTGCSELLILETMRLLKAEGAEEVSLGVAALSEMRSRKADFANTLNARSAKATRFLRLLYEKGDMFFGFQSLYRFKVKFKPTRIEPVYVLYSTNRFDFVAILSLLEAFLNGNIILSVCASLLRKFLHLRLGTFFTGLLRDGLVVRAVPPNFKRYCIRTKLTLVLLFLNMLAYILTTNRMGTILQSVNQRWAFSLHNLLVAPERPFWFVSAFLHLDGFHLFINMVTLILFAGTLEVLLGSWWAGICYLSGLLLSNPLLLTFVLYPVEKLGVVPWRGQLLWSDVGASLGIFACAGALAFLFKRGIILTGLLSTIIIFLTFVRHDLWELNHLFSLAIGYLVARVATR